MAEAYFRHLGALNNRREIEATSAGLSAIDGCDASTMAMETIGFEGLSLRNFKSARVDDNAIKNASIIVGMTNEHVRDIVCLFPHSKSKTYTLLSFLGSNGDIHDPYGGSYQEFRECLDQMKPALDALLDYLTPYFSN